MAQPYSNALRERVARAHPDGEPLRSEAAQFGVSVPRCRSGWRITTRSATSRRVGSAATAPGSDGADPADRRKRACRQGPHDSAHRQLVGRDFRMIGSKCDDTRDTLASVRVRRR